MLQFLWDDFWNRDFFSMAKGWMWKQRTTVKGETIAKPNWKDWLSLKWHSRASLLRRDRKRKLTWPTPPHHPTRRKNKTFSEAGKNLRCSLLNKVFWLDRDNKEVACRAYPSYGTRWRDAQIASVSVASVRQASGRKSPDQIRTDFHQFHPKN